MNNSTHHARPYGVGLAYRYVIHEAVMHFRDHIDLLEIPTADYIVRERLIHGDRDKRLLNEALHTYPSVAHGINLSIGSVQPPNTAYLNSTREFLQEHQLSIFSDHLAFHEMDGTDLSTFMCMPFDEISIEWLKRAYYHARREIGRPFALENVTYYFPVPNGSLEEADFFLRLTEETDCSLLLDATNVFNNSHNHGYDPMAFLDRFPLDRVSQIHLAGGHYTKDGLWEDSHSAPVMRQVWPLFEEIVRRTRAEIVIVERDSNFEEFEGVINDVCLAREIFQKHRAPQPTGPLPVFDSPNNVSFPDPEEFADLRDFQRAIISRLSGGDPVKIHNPEWARRFENCNPHAIDHVARNFIEKRKFLERIRLES